MTSHFAEAPMHHEGASVAGEGCSRGGEALP